jgi:hypothetical protein
MIGVGEHWEIVKKSRNLILSSRQFLQQLSGRFPGTREDTEPKATRLDSYTSNSSGRQSTDDSSAD